MAFIQITDVPAGMMPIAIIRNDAGQVWLPGTSVFGTYTNEGAATVTLTETPAGSRQFSATVALPNGNYAVTFKASSEVVGHTDLTVGTTNVSITNAIQPITAEPISPRIYDSFIEVSELTNETVVLANIKDGAGADVDLTGKQLRFIVYTRSGTVFQLDSAANPGRITVDNSAGTSVSIFLTATETARVLNADYVLRNITDGIVLAQDEFYVTCAPIGE